MERLTQSEVTRLKNLVNKQNEFLTEQNSNLFTNKEWYQMIFSYIESLGYHIKESSTGNIYYIFDYGDDNICHFHIKEFPGWRFAMWYMPDNEKILYFFTQYERYIDKFKPSRSTFCVELKTLYDSSDVDLKKKIVRDYSKDKDLTQISFEAYDIKEMLYYIKHNKYKAMYISEQEYQNKYECLNEIKCAWRLFKGVDFPNWNENVTKWSCQMIIRIRTIMLSLMGIVDWDVHNNNSDKDSGWHTSPEFDYNIFVKVPSLYKFIDKYVYTRWLENNADVDIQVIEGYRDSEDECDNK